MQTQNNNRTTPSDDEVREITGIYEDEENAIYNRAVEASKKQQQDETIANLEQNFDRPAITAEERNTNPAISSKEQESTTPPTDSSEKTPFYKKSWQKVKTTVQQNPKKAGGIGLGIVGIGSIAYLSVLSLGPLQFIHMSQILSQLHFGRQNDLTNTRTRQMIRYIRNPDSPDKTRLGHFANKYADRATKQLEKKGIKPTYTKANAYSIGYEIDYDKMGKDSELGRLVIDGDIEQTKANIAKEFGAKFETVSGKEVLVPDSKNLYKDKLFTKKVLRIAGLENKIFPIKSRILNKRGGNAGLFHPINKGVSKKIDEIIANRKAKLRIKTGQDTTLTAAPNTNEDGSQTPPDASQVEITDGANTVRGEAKKGKLKDVISLFSNNKVATGVAFISITGLTCLLETLAETIYDSQVANVLTPIMNSGTEAIAIGQQVMAGDDIDLFTLGVYAQNLYSKDFGTWDNAKSIQTNLGHSEKGVNQPAEAALNVQDNAALKLIETLRDGSVLGAKGAIDKICNPIVQAGTAVGSIVVAVFSAGASAGARIAALGTEIAKAIFSMGAQGIAMEQIQKAIINDPINVLNYKGGQYGALVDSGAFLASNEVFLNNGGKLLSNEQVAELNNDEREILAQENSNKSIFDKYFNLYAYDSAASKLLDSQTTNVANNITNTPKGLATIFSNNIKNISAVFSGRSFAASQATGYATYDYGLDYAGFSKSDISNKIIENPEENAEYVIDKNLLQKTVPDIGGTYYELFKRCNNLDVQADLTVSPLNQEESTQYQSSELMKTDGIATLTKQGKCGNDKDEDLLRLRFAIFDTQTAAAAACYIGDEEACGIIGIEPVSDIETGDNIVGSSEYTDNLTDIIKDGEKAVKSAFSLVDNSPDCGGSCKNRCLEMVSKIWQNAGGGIVASGFNADSGYQHYKQKGWVHDGADKYNVPLGAVMWSGRTSSGGHAYIYVGEGKIISTDLNCDSKICVSPAGDIEKVWNHEYLGWSDPHKEWGN